MFVNVAQARGNLKLFQIAFANYPAQSFPSAAGHTTEFIQRAMPLERPFGVSLTWIDKESGRKRIVILSKGRWCAVGNYE